MPISNWFYGHQDALMRGVSPYGNLIDQARRSFASMKSSFAARIARLEA